MPEELTCGRWGWWRSPPRVSWTTTSRAAGTCGRRGRARRPTRSPTPSASTAPAARPGPSWWGWRSTGGKARASSPSYATAGPRTGTRPRLASVSPGRCRCAGWTRAAGARRWSPCSSPSSRAWTATGPPRPTWSGNAAASAPPSTGRLSCGASPRRETAPPPTRPSAASVPATSRTGSPSSWRRPSRRCPTAWRRLGWPGAPRRADRRWRAPERC